VSSDGDQIPVQDRAQEVPNDNQLEGFQSDDDLSDYDSDYVPSTPPQSREEVIEHNLRDHEHQEDVVTPIRVAKKRKIDIDMSVIVGLCKSLVYRCEEEMCSKEFRRKADFDRHLLTHQGDEARHFVCDKCDKRFKLKGDLKRHSLSHATKQFTCEVCDAEFTTKGNLDRHRKTKHMQEKRFECEVCEKQFGQSGDLKRHSLTHVAPENRPFYCQKCHAGFAQKKNYVAHCKVH